MTKDNKVVQESDMKFYCNVDHANLDRYVFLSVECEGGTPPDSVVKTVIENKNLVTPIGDVMAVVGAGNLKSARFQLVKLRRDNPADIELWEEVYVFECFL